MESSAKRTRVLAALRGEATDHIAASIWLHNFRVEVDRTAFVDETLRLAARFDWDYLKPQVSAEQFPEMWGLKFEPGPSPSAPPTFTHFPIKRAADFGNLKPVALEDGPLADQLESLTELRTRLGPDIPIVWTVFSPLVVARTMLPGGQAQLLEMLRDDPRPLRAAFEAITATLIDYAREAVARGADGIFLATTFAAATELTTDERAHYELPLFEEILKPIALAPFNVLHLCGSRIAMREYAAFPVSAFSWADGGTNPNLAEGHAITGRAVMGGLPAKPQFAVTSEQELQRMAEQACTEMHRRWLLLAPGCSVNPGTPDAGLEKVAGAIAALRQRMVA